MKIETRVNGHFQIHLTPETDTEKFLVRQILDRAEKGMPVTLRADGEVAVMAVEA
jgi:hypothetical protein